MPLVQSWKHSQMNDLLEMRIQVKSLGIKYLRKYNGILIWRKFTNLLIAHFAE